MNRTPYAFALTTIAILGSSAVHSADDGAFGQDLKATIVLQGMPCDQITATQRNADSDYNASCKDGNRYHVFINPQGGGW